MVSRRFVVILLESSKFRIILQNRHSATFRGVLRRFTIILLQNCKFRGVSRRFTEILLQNKKIRGVSRRF